MYLDWDPKNHLNLAFSEIGTTLVVFRLTVQKHRQKLKSKGTAQTFQNMASGKTPQMPVFKVFKIFQNKSINLPLLLYRSCNFNVLLDLESTELFTPSLFLKNYKNSDGAKFCSTGQVCLTYSFISSIQNIIFRLVESIVIQNKCEEVNCWYFSFLKLCITSHY